MFIRKMFRQSRWAKLKKYFYFYHMTNKVVYFKSIGPVTFFRNRKSKNMKITVKPDHSVLLSFPFFVSDKEVLSFLARNENWIQKQQEKVRSDQKMVQEGTVIKTKLHQVEIKRGKENGKVEVKDDLVTMFVHDPENDTIRIYLENLLTKIYRYEAHNLLPPRLKDLARQHGFTYNKITIRNNKRNWGSCSPANNISLNLQMMKLPDKLIDYILLHELVHTRIKNHGERFWQELNRLTDNKARELAREVKKYSTYTW